MTRDLTIKDWPMFDRVVRDPEVCALMLETILGIEVGHIEYISDEHAEKPSLKGRGVRMDVFARSGEAVYDIEMQAVREPHIMHRMRYYQAAMDSAALPEGCAYHKLPESYIIFICDHDPFARGLPRYTIERTCQEDGATRAEDGAHWIALNAPAWEQVSDDPLSWLLEYVHTGRAQGKLASILDERVRCANEEEAWKEQAMGFMTLEMEMLVREDAAREEGFAKGEAEGLAEGEAHARERFQALIAKLSDEGRLAELESTASDPGSMDRLMAELGI